MFGPDAEARCHALMHTTPDTDHRPRGPGVGRPWIRRDKPAIVVSTPQGRSTARRRANFRADSALPATWPTASPPIVFGKKCPNRNNFLRKYARPTLRARCYVASLQWFTIWGPSGRPLALQPGHNMGARRTGTPGRAPREEGRSSKYWRPFFFFAPFPTRPLPRSRAHPLLVRRRRHDPPPRPARLVLASQR